MASKNVTVPKGDKVTIHFEHEKDSKNMVRYSELTASGNFEDHLVGKLYLHKAAFDALGQPSKVTIVVTKSK